MIIFHYFSEKSDQLNAVCGHTFAGHKWPDYFTEKREKVTCPKCREWIAKNPVK